MLLFFTILVAANGALSNTEVGVVTLEYVAAHGFASAQRVVAILQKMLDDFDSD